MKAASLHTDRFSFELSALELRMILAGLREADQELEDWEFQARTGFERNSMRALHEAIFKKEKWRQVYSYNLEFSAEEVRMILAGLREADRTLEGWELQTRTTFERSSLRAFHDDILAALNRAG
ncbi:hypothetical protein ABZ897_31550 [Nonomuraea sp. NPDC046802]|uniref:hypothetical protein n=1 Tax=Nonomuraea sp. NPDC046802 TaxID=3154919 RepID=UPI0033DF7F55